MEVLTLRIPEAAAALGISRSKAYELAAQGALPGLFELYPNGPRRVSVDVLRASIAEQATAGATNG